MPVQMTFLEGWIRHASANDIVTGATVQKCNSTVGTTLGLGQDSWYCVAEVPMCTN